MPGAVGTVSAGGRRDGLCLGPSQLSSTLNAGFRSSTLNVPLPCQDDATLPYVGPAAPKFRSRVLLSRGLELGGRPGTVGSCHLGTGTARSRLNSGIPRSRLNSVVTAPGRGRPDGPQQRPSRRPPAETVPRPASLRCSPAPKAPSTPHTPASCHHGMATAPSSFTSRGPRSSFNSIATAPGRGRPDGP